MEREDSEYEERDELFPEDEDDGDGDGDENDDDGFHVQDRLAAPVAFQVTTRELFHMVHDGVIELNPPYQRGTSGLWGAWRRSDTVPDVVWSEEKMSKLIDSIFRNFYIPPLLFAQVEVAGQEDPILRCVDGKQRLMSLQKFFDGHVRVPQYPSWTAYSQSEHLCQIACAHNRRYSPAVHLSDLVVTLGRR